MRISEVMALDVVTIEPDATVSEAWARMEDYRLRHLPVLRDGALVGIVSDRDLVEARGRLVTRVGEDGLLDPEPVTIGDILRPLPVTVTPDDTLGAAAARLVEWGVGSLPVVRGRALVGIVTETDVLEAFTAACRYGRAGSEMDPSVATRMTRAPVTGTAETTLREARAAMLRGDFRHLPVVDGADVAGRVLLGIVSDRDLRRASGAGEPEDAPLAHLLRGRRPHVADPDERLSRAAARMTAHRIGALPVEEHGRLLGVLTVTDVLEHCSRVLDELAAEHA